MSLPQNMSHFYEQLGLIPPVVWGGVDPPTSTPTTPHSPPASTTRPQKHPSHTNTSLFSSPIPSSKSPNWRLDHTSTV
jgi:hypothetical protein